MGYPAISDCFWCGAGDSSPRCSGKSSGRLLLRRSGNISATEGPPAIQLFRRWSRPESSVSRTEVEALEQQVTVLQRMAQHRCPEILGLQTAHADVASDRDG